MLSNQAAAALTTGIPAHVLEPTVNVFRICRHPDGLASRTVNFDEWADDLLRQIGRTIQLTQNPLLEELEVEILGYPNVVALTDETPVGSWDDPPLLVPFQLDLGEVQLSMFTTLTTFGTPRDITLEELSVEFFFPADDVTEAVFQRSLASDASA